MSNNKTGTFVISLDFELHWGVSDHSTVQEYYENLINTPKAIHQILSVFSTHQVHCTWATVGMLFCKNKQELFSYVPENKRPQFNNPRLSNYFHAQAAGENEAEDPFHYALSVIQKLKDTPNQEVSTHTFSHYNCMEQPLNPAAFEADIEAAVTIAKENKVEIRSIVFPRNQMSASDLEACKKNGIQCFRGTQKAWFYQPVTRKSEKQLHKRILRWLDQYINITGHNGHCLHTMEQLHPIINIPQSRLLRPYFKSLSLLEPIRIKRIKREMTNAAKEGKMYHLWWHPHNFGKNMDKNLAILGQLVTHYKSLEKQYGMVSMNMSEVYDNFFSNTSLKHEQ